MLDLTTEEINKAHDNINYILDKALIKLLKANQDKSIVGILEYIVQQPTNLKIRGLWQNTVPC